MEQSININAISRIAAGTIVKGEIVSPTDFRLDGSFEGKIECKGKLVVGESATIKGDVICENIDLFGKLEGNLLVHNVLSMMDGCQILGDIQTHKLVVELGASFTGNCKMVDKEKVDNKQSK